MITLDRTRLERLHECQFARAHALPEEREACQAHLSLVSELLYLLKSFSVILCQKHPHEKDFDDACTGADYATLEEARAIFSAADPVEAMSQGSRDPTFFRQLYSNSIPYVWLLGPGVEEVRKLPGADRILARFRREEEAFQRECQRERAMQAGMMGGCEAYNEAMGWEV